MKFKRDEATRWKKPGHSRRLGSARLGSTVEREAVILRPKREARDLYGYGTGEEKGATGRRISSARRDREKSVGNVCGGPSTVENDREGSENAVPGCWFTGRRAPSPRRCTVRLDIGPGLGRVCAIHSQRTNHPPMRPTRFPLVWIARGETRDRCSLARPRTRGPVDLASGR